MGESWFDTCLLYLATFLGLSEEHVVGPLGQEPRENIREKSIKFARKWGRENAYLLGRTSLLYKENFHFSHNRELEGVRDIHPSRCFSPFLKGFPRTFLVFFTFLTTLSFSLDYMMLKLSFLLLLSFCHQNVLLDNSSVFHMSS